MARSEHEFLDSVIERLTRLRMESEEHGRPMLVYLIDLARAEAEDEQRADALALRQFSEFKQAGMRQTQGQELDRDSAYGLGPDGLWAP